MEYLEYLAQKKTLQKVFIAFLDNEENIEENFENLNNLIKDQNIKTNESEFRLFIRFIENISSEHHRTKHFFSKIEKVLLLFKKEFGKYLTVEEAFNIFKYNKRVFLFLLQNQFVKMNFELSNFLKNYKHFYPEYFSFEIKEFFPSFSDLIDDPEFEQLRLNGENDISYCQIIRNDSITEFVQYIKSHYLPLDTRISSSIFETNSFLLFLDPTLIEYSAFFGSIQIFKYLIENNVEMTPSLWLYSIHGRNIEILKILKENKIEPKDKTYTQCLEEAIRCHHYEIFDFIQKEFQLNDFDYSKNINYYNFISFPDDLFDNRNNFFYFCKYDYAFIVEQFLKRQNIYLNFKIGDVIEGISFIVTPFLSAINSDNCRIVEMLLNQNEIDVNLKAIMCQWAVNETILDALMLAILNHNSRMVRLLLNNKNINVNEVTIGKHFYENSIILYEEKYPIHKAVLEKNMEILKLLLAHQNIDVNVKYKSVKYYSYSTKNIIDSWEKTALQFAIEIEDLDIIKVLLNHPKIDVNCKTKAFDAKKDYDIESSPLYDAIYVRNIEIIKLLLSHPNIDVNQILFQQIEKIPIKKTILNFVIQSEKVEIVKLLLSHPKIDVNKISIIEKRGSSQFLPLDTALEVSSIEIYKLLLEHKNIDINLKVKSQSDDKITIYGALISAITSNKTDFVKLLLNRKDINVNDIMISDTKNEKYIEKSILSFAIDAERENMVNLLLDHPDIDINVKDIERKNNGSTMKRTSLLHKIFSTCSIDIITKVLDHKKVDINVKSYNKMTNRYSVVEEELTTLYVAIYLERLDIIQLLLAKTNLDTQLNSTKITLYSNTTFKEEVASSLKTAISIDNSEIFCFLLDYLIKNKKLTDKLDELLMMTNNECIISFINANIKKQK